MSEQEYTALDKTVDDFLKNILPGVRENVKTSGELLPTFFIHGEDGGMDVVASPFTGDTYEEVEAFKEKVALSVKLMCLKKMADFVIFVSEAWMLETAEANKEFDYNRKDYPEGLSSHPRRKEIVMISVETKDGHHRFGRADINPGREMGEIEWTNYDGFAGRFSNLLPPYKKLESLLRNQSKT